METLTKSQKSQVERELEAFKESEARRLNLSAPPKSTEQWRDDNPTAFSRAQRATTTVLTTGFPEATLNFVARTLRPIGLNVKPFESPGQSAYEIGKEYGNRGQCNPTYFTVGSLIQYLIHLRDVEKIPVPEIIKNYVYITAGGCGPCRMGMYATEYRKALRDSGFSGFRVVLLSRTGEANSADSSGLDMGSKVLLKGFVALMVADILNLMEKRMRPYEREEGSTERAIRECRDVVEHALENGKSLLRAAYRCRKILRIVPLDRSRVRPRVLVQGEFWAKTTEGEGNYNLFRFLEKEGAEAHIETISDWLLHQIWRARWSMQRRADLRRHDASADGLKGENIRTTRLKYRALEKSFRIVFGTLQRIIGLADYRLTDNDELARLASPFIDSHIDGGEDNMEIGHHVHAVTHNLANMVLSVKPFTCLSSNGVSDGIQPIISELYTKSVFASVETDGDSPTAFYGRIQMQLFKAKKAAEREVEEALERTGLSLADVARFQQEHPQYDRVALKLPREYSCVAANLILAVAQKTGAKAS